METYRITKNELWVANVLADRLDSANAGTEVGKGALHFYIGKQYVAGFYPDVTVTLADDGTVVYEPAKLEASQ